MIIATAGHVDHGKTSLVRALIGNGRGTDTDRLPEEQRRGMTIDLGFAFVPGDDTAQRGADDGAQFGAGGLAFVDVPGHERFVRNMLAGVAAVDAALLVVAADDGPMPQTREHLAILGLLGVPRLLVALSKIDRVDAERQQAALAEVRALLATGPHADAPVFALASTTGDGVPALLAHLQTLARALAARPVAGHFRLVIDRSFLVAGAGRVVTGTVLAGRLRLGDAVVVSPAGTVARVRGLHAQNHAVEQVRVGQRCAINLAGADVKRAEPARGDWLVAPAAHAPTSWLDVQLQVLPGEAKALGTRGNFQLHLGAAAVGARLTPLDADMLAPGATAFARLVLDRPVSAAWGERFILRDPAANRTVGGGWVIDPFGPVRGRARPARVAQLAALALPDAAQALAAGLALALEGLDLGAFAMARNLLPADLHGLKDRLGLHAFSAQGAAWAVSGARWAACQSAVLAGVDRWHAEQPDSLGPDEAALLAAKGADEAPPTRALLRAVLAELIDAGALARDGMRWRRPGHWVALSADDEARLQQALACMLPGGLRPPIVGELATAVGRPLPELMAWLDGMARRGLLVRVAPNRYYPPEAVASLIAQARALAAEREDGSCDAAAYRDRTGIGRNLAVQVLEFLDRVGVTRFDGVRHRLLP